METGFALIVSDHTAMEIAEMDANPAAMPSKPSIRLNALTIPTTQQIVSGIPIYMGKSVPISVWIPFPEK